MSVNKDNNIFEKTSFLGNNSSEFVETLYAEYLNNPSNLSIEWKKFFEGLNEKREKIIKNANGPSWSPKKKLNLFRKILKVIFTKKIMIKIFQLIAKIF